MLFPASQLLLWGLQGPDGCALWLDAFVNKKHKMGSKSSLYRRLS
jgi:hypothetical protein